MAERKIKYKVDKLGNETMADYIPVVGEDPKLYN